VPAKRHLFLTRRPEALPSWDAAFPGIAVYIVLWIVIPEEPVRVTPA